MELIFGLVVMAVVEVLAGFGLGYIFMSRRKNDPNDGGTLKVVSDEDGTYIFLESTFDPNVLEQGDTVTFTIDKPHI